MAVTGNVKRVAFYCRMNHRDRDYTQFHDEIFTLLDEKYGKGRWDIRQYFEVASGADPSRKKLDSLKAAVREGKVDAVVSVNASMIARDWMQFMDFMDVCAETRTEVFCTRGPDMAWPVYERICRFRRSCLEGRKRT